ncbi:MAG: SMP-30/gluconolactonase/LRE family protein [Planctomycetota bacterium]|nr:SMP-30/gluconolactonase/LRE family protein [Planctomycetota bacterium]
MTIAELKNGLARVIPSGAAGAEEAHPSQRENSWESAAMVNLHRWLKRTSPHLVIAGTLVISGVAGCRSTQYSATTLEPGYPPHAIPFTIPGVPVAEPTGTPYDEPDLPPEAPGSELILEAPAPPPIGTGIGTGTNSAIDDSGTTSAAAGSSIDGVPPKAPVPEDAPLDVLTSVEQTEPTQRETEQNLGVTKNSGTVGASNPLDESNLIPDDSPQITGTPDIGGSTGEPEAATSDTANPVTENGEPTLANPLIKSFESSLANPEVPIPTPAQSASKDDVKAELLPEINLPEISSEAAERVESAVEENTTSAPETSNLFPPPKVELPLLKDADSTLTPRDADAGKNVNVDRGVDKNSIVLPQSVDKDEPENGGAASLPVVAPSIVPGQTTTAIRLTTPLPEPLSPTNSQKTGNAPKPSEELLASIARLDASRPSTSPLKGSAGPRPLFPTNPSRKDVGEDAITVVAEISSPAHSVVFDQDGNAFVTHGKDISIVSPDGNVDAWASMGAPRGHVVLRDGTHLVCDASQRAIVKLSSAGEQLGKLATRSDGYFLRAPNNLVVDSDGGVYFSDPGYARIRNPIGRIHYVARDGSVNVVAQELAFPEGLGLTPDGSRLLVVESQNQQVLQFELLSPGRVGPKSTFAELPKIAGGEVDGFANGLTVRPDGRVFVAHGDRQHVQMFSPDGRLLKSIGIGASVNSVAFRSDDFSRIFATGGTRSGNGSGQLFEVKIAE